MNDAATPRQSDPIGWCWLLALAFLGLTAIRLTIPSAAFFDETHYIPAAKELLALGRPVNIEHPLLGKELIAAGIALLGDNALGWRLFGWLAGGLALISAMRAMWFASQSPFATLAGGFLMASGFVLFVQARIAMLDIHMLAFLLLALWQIAAAVRSERHLRKRLALAGVALGLSLASKWSGAGVALLPGLALLALRLKSSQLRFLTARDAAPLRGVALWEAGLWLGLLPLATYCASFAPAFFYAYDPLTWGQLLPLQLEMVDLQEQVKDAHPYASRWWQWLLNLRAIWYLYEEADGALRGVMLVGNPLTMLAGLPALAWCLWAGIARRHHAALAMALLYGASMAFWVLAPKPVQFYFHYLLPSCFLLGALALALDELRQKGFGWVSWTLLAMAGVLFAFFYPILSAAELPEVNAFLRYAWISAWR